MINLTLMCPSSICVMCGVEKPHIDFYLKDKKCKDCRKKLVRLNRLDNIEKYRQYDKLRNGRSDRVEARREYTQSNAGKISKSKTISRYRSENPNKYKAHNALNNAVRDGIIIKPLNCECCNDSNRLHGHHDDYSKPLEVRWLCAKCHKKWHIEHGEALNP